MLHWILMLLLLMNGYVHCETLSNVTSTTINSMYLKSCDINKNCSSSSGLMATRMICLNGRCQCPTSYKWNPHIQDCEYQQHLLVFSGIYSLRCPIGYIEDPLADNVCRPRCVEDSDCVTRDPNSHCNVFRCHCNVNHRRNPDTEKCEPFRCEYDSQCWSDGDVLRECRNGTCVCDYDLDERTKTCMIKWFHIYRSSYYTRARVAQLLLLTIFIVPLVFLYCFISNMKKARSTFVSVMQPPITVSRSKNPYFPTTQRTMMEIMKQKQNVYSLNPDSVGIVFQETKINSKKKSSNAFKYQRFQ